MDLVLIIVHCLHRKSICFESLFFFIETDHGLAEIFQYAQELAIAILLILSAKRLKLKALYSWAALFLYIVADDSLSIHENLGAYLAELGRFAPSFLRPQDVGELIVSGSAGAIFFSAIGVCYFKGGPRFRSISHDIAILFSGLVFFGVFVDALHGMLYKIGELGLIEDSGEMIVISLILVYVAALFSIPEERQIRIVESIWAFVRARFS